MLCIHESSKKIKLKRRQLLSRIGKRPETIGFLRESGICRSRGFTSKPFSGDPAVVCVMYKWVSEDSMMKLAIENNLSETKNFIKFRMRRIIN